MDDFVYSFVVTAEPIGILSAKNTESLEKYNREYMYSKQSKSLDEHIAHDYAKPDAEQTELHTLQRRRLRSAPRTRTRTERKQAQKEAYVLK